MATHALLPSAGFESPENDGTGVVGTSQGPAIRGTSYRSNVARVAGEQTQAITTRDVPHPHRPIAGTSEDI